MDFRTSLQIEKSYIRIDHTTIMMLFGSCFSENIGRKLKDHKFKVILNPFGILYNPLSISNCIIRLLENRQFNESDIVFNNEIHHSFMHHGCFSDTDKQNCLKNINDEYVISSEFIKDTELFLITFGTAYAFKLKSNHQIVSNCHKFPANNFIRFRLTIDEIVDEWSNLIEQFINNNSNVKFIFTVSPIRHLKDGAHDNQISKSILHIAIENLRNRFRNFVEYFPAYEIMIDELRDYRFYNEDMIHPTSLAQDYIWQSFSGMFFSEETKKINSEWNFIKKSIDHRPLYTETQAYHKFIINTIKSTESFAKRYPQLSCEEELKQLSGLLEKANNI